MYAWRVMFHSLLNMSQLLCHWHCTTAVFYTLHCHKVGQFIHRGKILDNIMSFTTEGSVAIDGSTWSTLPKENAGCLGWGRAIDSLPRRTTTLDMVGLCSGSSCTHRSPICMHLTTSVGWHDSNNTGSTNSNSLPSFCSLHACHCLN